MKLQISEQDRILVVAPHPDDETIGCGGFLALYGRQSDVLLLTDGRMGVPSNDTGDTDICDVRKNELKDAMKETEIENVFFLDAPDGALRSYHMNINEVNLKPYTYVFVPNPWENHEDHRAAYHLVKKWMKKQGAKARLMQYEVWTTLRDPDYFLDISTVMDRKRNMIRKYKSQLIDKNYLAAAEGLSCYRGMYPGYDYAEAFSSDGWKHTMWAYYNRMPVTWKRRIRKLLRR